MSKLFQSVDFKSHSGLELTWKIECDALSDPEWFTIKKMIMEYSPPFREAVGIPKGGVKLGDLLNEHATGNEEDPVCIVDDVVATGGSIIGQENMLNKIECNVVCKAVVLLEEAGYDKDDLVYLERLPIFTPSK